jgi:hypothetical protein
MTKQKRKVAVGPREQELARKAEKMMKAGKKSFSEVYGDDKPFDMGADKAAMSAAGFGGGAGMLTAEQVADAEANNAPPAAVPEVPPAAPETATAVPQMPEASEVAPATTSPQEPPEDFPEDPVERVKAICERLKQINPNAPGPQAIMEWKRMHGDVFLLNIENHVFIYRYLKRQEWIQINANPRFNEMQEHQVEEMIFDKCVLWPGMDPVQRAALPAGAMGMVVQQVRLQSLFLEPGFVAQMTIKM